MSKRTIRKLRHRDDLQHAVDAVGVEAVRQEAQRRHQRHVERARDAEDAASSRDSYRSADVVVEMQQDSRGCLVRRPLTRRQVRARRREVAGSSLGAP